MRWCVLLFVFLLIPVVSANEVYTNSLTLLAVAEVDGERIGSTADLTLEVIDGRGRVFLDTYPLTKLDTQISTRIAKQIACSLTNISCEQYDFIYTIRSGSPIIGGPSAGAAITALTVATLEQYDVDQSVAITGTINSGGLVGAVGGVREKMKAASEYGIKTVVVPFGDFEQDLMELNNSNQTNATTTSDNATNMTVYEYAQEIGVSVVEVGNIYDVLTTLTGVEYTLPDRDVQLPAFYSQIMRMLADELCTRSQQRFDDLFLDYTINNTRILIDDKQILIEGNQTRLANSSLDINQTFTNLVDLMNRSQFALAADASYTAASYCYGAGINVGFLEYVDEPIDSIEMLYNQTLELIQPDVTDIQTMMDLQTFMLVTERIEESENHVQSAKNALQQNRTYNAINSYVTAVERLYSAEAWSKFFQNRGREFEYDTRALAQGCELRIQEAEERKNFLQLYVPIAMTGVGELEAAKNNSRDGNYALCLFRASKAKAEMDVVLSVMGVSEESTDQFIAEKAKIASNIIYEQRRENIFPVIGYSYYEYGNSLQEFDKSASLLYLQYAIELSNLEPYLATEEKTQRIVGKTRNAPASMFLFGVAAGILFAIVVLSIDKRLRRDSDKSQKK